MGWIGASTGDASDVRRLETEGADYLGVGPVFPTTSRVDAWPAIGVEGLGEVVEAASVPVVAIGGINQANAGQVMDVGARGAAVISALFGARDVKRAATTLSSRTGSRPV